MINLSHKIIARKRAAGGGGGTLYLGYPTTAGVPDAPLGSFVSYGVPGDRIYSNVVTGIAGTIDALNIRNWNYLSDCDYAYGVAYVNDVLVARTANLITSIAETWTDYMTLIVEGGESLVVGASDVVNFGLGYDEGPGNMMSRDNGAADTLELSSTTWTAITPPTPVTFSGSSNAGLATILRVLT